MLVAVPALRFNDRPTSLQVLYLRYHGEEMPKVDTETKELMEAISKELQSTSDPNLADPSEPATQLQATPGPQPMDISQPATPLIMSASIMKQSPGTKASAARCLPNTTQLGLQHRLSGLGPRSGMEAWGCQPQKDWTSNRGPRAAQGAGTEQSTATAIAGPAVHEAAPKQLQSRALQLQSRKQLQSRPPVQLQSTKQLQARPPLQPQSRIQLQSRPPVQLQSTKQLQSRPPPQLQRKPDPPQMAKQIPSRSPHMQSRKQLQSTPAQSRKQLQTRPQRK